MTTYYDTRPTDKDYSQPIYVDCSVEYELPNAAKPPPNVKSERLLMIHPSYYRRRERHSPFIINLPANTSRPRPPVHYPMTRLTKNDPLLCGTSGDSGVGGMGHWPDPQSPLFLETRLQSPDSGIGTTLSGTCWESTTETASTRLYDTTCQANQDTNRELKDSTNQINQVPRLNVWGVNSNASDFLNCGEVNNNLQHQTKDPRLHQQPAVAVAAVAACKVCQPQFLHPQPQRPQQPWPGVGVTTPAVACAPPPTSRQQRVCALEPGPELAAYPLTRHTQPTRPAPPARPAPAVRPSTTARPALPAKRSRQSADCCKLCTQWNYPQCRATQDNSRILWNNESMLRLYQV